jgi:DOPA 4,5-dioxygenase
MMSVSDYYHAHVYFEADQIGLASQLHRELAEQFRLVMGRIFSVPIGPHPKPMFQAIFEAEQFAEVVTWLLHNRKGLDVLVHGVSGDDLHDHTELTMWLGKSHPLDLSVLS